MSENSSRSRRALLTGGAVLLGGAVLADQGTAEAADGHSVLLGRSNKASHTTKVTASGGGHGLVGNSSGGYGIAGESTKNHGGVLRTHSNTKWGAVAENLASKGGNGGALLAHGGHSIGISATNATVSHSTIAASNGSDGKGGDAVAVKGLVGSTSAALKLIFRAGAGMFAGPYGVIGVATGASGSGVAGAAVVSGGVGIEAAAVTGATAIRANGPSVLNGDVTVNGTLSKQGGSFKIDHPQDPANKYLYHSFVESPDMKNVYDGVVTADAHGNATVTMPAWFESLNSDFRYQLTALGGAAPGLNVSKEIAGGRFGIAGALAGQRISWQVTGIRKDSWANDNRIPVEETKPKAERGTYLYPEGAGKSASAGLAARISPLI